MCKVLPLGDRDVRRPVFHVDDKRVARSAVGFRRLRPVSDATGHQSGSRYTPALVPESLSVAHPVTVAGNTA